jgi:hypothetical protein
MAARKKPKTVDQGGQWCLELTDPHTPAAIEFYAARVAQDGDAQRADELRALAGEVRQAQAQTEAATATGSGGSVDSSGAEDPGE